MTLKEYLLTIEQWLKDYLSKTNAKKYVLGLSGGVDSSLVAAIAKNAVGKDNLICIAMPIHSNKNDLIDAKKVASELDIDLKVIDLSNTFDTMMKDFFNPAFSTMTKSNMKVRLRMVTLYAYAQEHNALVLGTDNKDEYYVGYFTKYGDGGVDLLPIVHLTKSEVVEAAKMYGLSNALAERTPTAGLFEGQTDEGEMGIKYCDLDHYLLNNEASIEVKNRIEHLHRVSEHKRTPIPKMNDFDRD